MIKIGGYPEKAWDMDKNSEKKKWIINICQGTK